MVECIARGNPNGKIELYCEAGEEWSSWRFVHSAESDHTSLSFHAMSCMICTRDNQS